MLCKKGRGEDYLCLVLWLFVAMLRLLLLLLGERGLVEIWLQKPSFMWYRLEFVRKAVEFAKNEARENMRDVWESIIMYL